MAGNCPLCMAYTTIEPPVLSDLANSPTGVPPTVSRTRLSFFPSRVSSISLCRLSPWRTTRSPPHCRTCSAASSRRTTFSVLTPASFASNDVLPHGRVGRGLTDPVAGHQGNVSVEQEIGGNRVNPYHRELQGICFVAHRHDVAHWGDNLVRPRALLVGRNNQDSLTLQSNINLRSNLRDSANTLRADRGWEGRTDAVEAAGVQEVRWINRRRFHRDENILLAESRLGDRVEFNHIGGFSVSYELQLPPKKPF